MAASQRHGVSAASAVCPQAAPQSRTGRAGCARWGHWGLSAPSDPVARTWRPGHRRSLLLGLAGAETDQDSHLRGVVLGHWHFGNRESFLPEGSSCPFLGPSRCSDIVGVARPQTEEQSPGRVTLRASTGGNHQRCDICQELEGAWVSRAGRALATEEACLWWEQGAPWWARVTRDAGDSP